MGDHPTISEEMVKLIFTPLRESLVDTTNAIKESSQELRNLLEAISKHPDKSDLKNSTDHLIETVKYDFTNKTQLLEVLITTKLKESTDTVLSVLESTKPEIQKNQERLNIIVRLLTKTSTDMASLTEKVDKLMLVIGITFAVAMIAWGCLAFFFQVNLPTK